MEPSQASHSVELEAAKFLHKLIQESKDEPAKLATKLYVILHHMKGSGKDNTMPYQVISRAMETVINQHGLDIEALKASRLSLDGANQMGDSMAPQYAGSSQVAGPAKMTGSGTQRSSQSLDHESPSSLETKSATSQSQERGVNQKDGKKAVVKRKRGDSSLSLEQNVDIPQQHDSRNATVNLRKGKMSKVESMSGFSAKVGENNSFNMVPNSGQLEVSSAHMTAGQQGSPLSTAHESLVSKGGWNQNKGGLPLERSQGPRFSSNVVSGNMMSDVVPLQHSTLSSLGSSGGSKVQGGMPFTSGSYPAGELGFSGPVLFGGSEHQKHGLTKGAGASPLERVGEAHFFPGNRMEDIPNSLPGGKALENDGGTSNMYADANRILQGGRQVVNPEMSMIRPTAPRDLGKSPVPQGSVSLGMPFKEQQLKQLRAQCLVFLAFRNGLLPKKLHLDIALGNIVPKDGVSLDGHRNESIDLKGNVQASSDLTGIPEVSMPFGRPNSVREIDKALSDTSSTGRHLDGNSLTPEADKLNIMKAEMQIQETVESQPDLASARGGLAFSNPMQNMENAQILPGKSDQASSMSWTGIGNHNDVPRGSAQSIGNQHELILDRKDNAPSQFNSPGTTFSDDQNLSEFRKRCILDASKAILPADALRNGISCSKKHEDGDKSAPTDLQLSPKYTTSEKWILDYQRKKLSTEQNWVLKQQKTKQKIATCFDKLKETVSSSEDISARTKSVIELKKLQLLELQRRLRSNFLNDFFKPITADIDRLKSYKKYKHGRRVKQLERFEQKMKEERQKRIRERQKEFFAEIEVHKEKLDDVFKIKRERWKGFNRYVKEFHKKKERIHREKIDRIQREKINLLKINDVEGYLRMVQDAKSDRVKQLLKETEKYLQKLGSKLQQAKNMARQFENDGDEARTATVVEKNETTVENEDESDQAKHYMESNEKYYLMAHSVKESIADQPSSLLGGKLREYQLNGLRWLVSLYNNHLNGILADEMGLGKTVQVISLMCYLMETKNDRGPFLVVVPSSVLPGWESEINFWAPGIHKIVYSGPPEERRKLFKEKIVQQKFNVLLTTYEYLMNKHDRPKLSKVHWHYIIIDEGHRIKNASCKLNADLKHYQSSHRLLLTGTPLQNNLEELWALLNFLLPNIFNSSEDFSQWFNKPFEGNGDTSAEQALLSEEENLLIINRLHQVLRPFVLRRLKHKVENELPEKIERLIRCEASAYQKLLMKRVEDNLGSIGNPKARSVHNSVMELRNICNHPYLSQLHAEEIDNLIPKHFLPPIVRLCGKLEMLDRLLPKLKATDHRVLFFSTMTRLLDVMEEYLTGKQYRYLRLDGHTSGGDRGSLIDNFNKPDSPYFIFLLSIRAGGVGVNLQAADTVIIFDTDWNPQVDLQAQARAHRIGQKREVLVLRFETVQTVEEQVRAAAEHKLGVANQSITAGFFDNNTSAEDRREYLESLLRESKKDEAAPVLDDDGLNDILARSESEIDVFESVDKQRQERELATWKSLLSGRGTSVSEPVPPLPSRLVTDDDLKEFCVAMNLYDVPKAEVASNTGVKRKGQSLGGLDTQHYGRGKRAREVRSYEEQWTEEEFEKLCKADSPDSPQAKEEMIERNLPKDASGSILASTETEAQGEAEPEAQVVVQAQAKLETQAVVQAQAGPETQAPPPQPLPLEAVEPPPQQQSKDVTTPSKRGRGRPRRGTSDKSPTTLVFPENPGAGNIVVGLAKIIEPSPSKTSAPDSSLAFSNLGGTIDVPPQTDARIGSGTQSVTPSVSTTVISQSTPAYPSLPMQSRGRGRKVQGGVQAPRRRGKKQGQVFPSPVNLAVCDPNIGENLQTASIPSVIGMDKNVSSTSASQCVSSLPPASTECETSHLSGPGSALDLQTNPPLPLSSMNQSSACPSVPTPIMSQGRKPQSAAGTHRRRGMREVPVSPSIPDVLASQLSKSDPTSQDSSTSKAVVTSSNQENIPQEPRDANQVQGSRVADQDQNSSQHADDRAQHRQPTTSSVTHDSSTKAVGSSSLGQIHTVDIFNVASAPREVSNEDIPSSAKDGEPSNANELAPTVPSSGQAFVEAVQNQTSDEKTSPVVTYGSLPLSYPSVAPIPSLNAPETMAIKRQGRKASSRLEAPRRRGRKQVPVSSTADSSTGHPNLTPQTQSTSQDALGAKGMPLRSSQDSDPKELMNTAQEIHSPPGLASQYLKRKASSGNPAFSRIETADITDIARVMKEIFSETASSKIKIGEASRNEARNAPCIPVHSKLGTDVSTQSSDDGKHESPSSLEAVATPIVGSSAMASEQSGHGMDVKMRKDNVCAVEEASVSPNDISELKSDTGNDLVKDLSDSIHASVKDDGVDSTVEISDTIPLNTDEKESVTSPRALLGSFTGPNATASDNQVSSPVTSPGKPPGFSDISCGDKVEISSTTTQKTDALTNFLDCPTISMKPDDTGDHHTMKPSVSSVMEPSETNHGDKVEASFSKSSAASSPCTTPVVDPTISTEFKGVYSDPTPVCTDQDHSGAQITPGFTELTFENSSEPCPEASPEFCPTDVNSAQGLISTNDDAVGDQFPYVTSEPKIIEHVPKEHDKAELPLDVGKPEYNQIAVCSVEEGPSGIQNAEDDNSGTKLSEITEGGSVQVCDAVEENALLPSDAAVRSTNMEPAFEDHVGTQLQSGTPFGVPVPVTLSEDFASTRCGIQNSDDDNGITKLSEINEGDSVQVCDAVGENASLPSNVADGSADMEPAIEDHVGAQLQPGTPKEMPVTLSEDFASTSCGIQNAEDDNGGTKLSEITEVGSVKISDAVEENTPLPSDAADGSANKDPAVEDHVGAQLQSGAPSGVPIILSEDFASTSCGIQNAEDDNGGTKLFEMTEVGSVQVSDAVEENTSLSSDAADGSANMDPAIEDHIGAQLQSGAPSGVPVILSEDFSSTSCGIQNAEDDNGGTKLSEITEGGSVQVCDAVGENASLPTDAADGSENMEPAIEDHVETQLQSGTPVTLSEDFASTSCGIQNDDDNGGTKLSEISECISVQVCGAVEENASLPSDAAVQSVDMEPAIEYGVTQLEFATADGVPVTLLKDADSTSCGIQNAEDDNGGTKLSKTPEGGFVQVYDAVEEHASLPTEAAAETANIEPTVEDRGTQLQSNVEESEAVCEVHKMQTDLPELLTSLPKGLPSSSQQELNSSTIEISHEVDVSLTVKVALPDISGSPPHLTCTVTENENFDSLCEKGLEGESQTVENQEGSEIEMGNQADTSHVAGVTSEDSYVNVAPSASALMMETETDTVSVGQGMVEGEIAPEEEKDSDSVMICQIDAPPCNTIVPENTVESMVPLSLEVRGTVEGSPENVLAGSSSVPEESAGTKAEHGDNTTLPDCIPLEESMAMDEDKAEDKSNKDLVCRSGELENLTVSESEASDQMDVSENRAPAVSSDQEAQPEVDDSIEKAPSGSQIVVEMPETGKPEPEMESSSENNLHGSSVVEGSKESATEKSDQKDQVDLPLPSTALEETRPSIVEEKCNNSSEDNPPSVSEEPKQTETECEHVVSGPSSEDTSRDKDIPSSSSPTTVSEKIPDSPGNNNAHENSETQ